MDMGKIDPNFKIETKLDCPDAVFSNVLDPRFRIEGLIREEDGFVRMPSSIPAQISSSLQKLNRQLAGGQVRFRCDSSYIALSLQMRCVGKMSHFPLTGSAGCDLYVRENGEEIFTGLFRPPFDIAESYEAKVNFKSNAMREITINLPLYAGIRELYIGYQEGSHFEPARPFTYEKPVAFYGSSITQGGCASRPGNSYEAMLARELDFPQINLGFSGNGKGERIVAEHIASLELSAFVLDYDANAPDPDYLLATHEPFFRVIREAQPELPILMLSIPKFHLNEEYQRRRDIIRKTYENARAAGDKKVWFLSGQDLVAPPYAEMALVDGAHPNDLGFFAMAQRIRPVLEKMLRGESNED